MGIGHIGYKCAVEVDSGLSEKREKMKAEMHGLDAGAAPLGFWGFGR